MRKTIILFFAIVSFFVIAAQFILAAETKGGSKEIFVGGEKGYFEYPRSYDKNSFTVWDMPVGCPTNVGYLGGKITSQTKVLIHNSALGKSKLKLLTGEQVLVYGEYYTQGSGEGSVDIFTKLIIFVLPGKDGQKESGCD